ncbi:MAG: hypothetical protein ACLP7P_04655 [Rhodomicrobium sp.]
MLADIRAKKHCGSSNQNDRSVKKIDRPIASAGVRHERHPMHEARPLAPNLHNLSRYVTGVDGVQAIAVGNVNAAEPILDSSHKLHVVSGDLYGDETGSSPFVVEVIERGAR